MSNVINLFDVKNRQKEQEVEVSTEELEQIMLTNKKNEERLRKERLKANKDVLKSYRIKS
jgi:predicted secreted acid phosphatase